MDRLAVRRLINRLLVESNERVLAQMRLPPEPPAPQPNPTCTVQEEPTLAQRQEEYSATTAPNVARNEANRHDSDECSSTILLRGATNPGRPRRTPPQPPNRYIPLPMGQEGARVATPASLHDTRAERMKIQAQFGTERANVSQMERRLPNAAEEKRDMFQAWYKLSDKFQVDCRLNADQKRWLDKRRSIIEKVQNCIKVCFQGNEKDFFSQPTSLPSTASRFFKCPRQAKCLSGSVQNRSPRVVNDTVVAKSAASGNGRGNCLPPSCQAQDEFLDAQKRLQNIECQRSSNPEMRRKAGAGSQHSLLHVL